MGGVAGSGLGSSVGDYAMTFEDLDNTVQTIDTGTNPKLHAVEIDCSQNTAQDVYVRVWDDAATPATDDDSDMCFLGKAGQITTYIAVPYRIAVAKLYCACVQEAGCGSGTTAPSGQVDVKMLITQGT